MTATEPYARILSEQSTGSKAKQALMVASQELGVFTYREGYQLSDPDQRDALEHTLRHEFNTSIALPEVGDIYTVSYLVVINGAPVLVPEEDAVQFTLGAVLALAGVQAARRVSYRPGMLPADPS